MTIQNGDQSSVRGGIRADTLNLASQVDPVLADTTEIPTPPVPPSAFILGPVTGGSEISGNDSDAHTFIASGVDASKVSENIHKGHKQQ